MACIPLCQPVKRRLDTFGRDGRRETRVGNHNIDQPQNTFSLKPGSPGFNVFGILLVDLVLEVELGIWMALFAHLLRIMNSVSAKLLDDLAAR